MYGADAQAGLGCQFFKNGTAIGGRTSGTLGLTNGWALSGYDSVGLQETMDMEVAELVLYKRRLSGTERQTVEAYLNAKWFAPAYDSVTTAYVAASGLPAPFVPALDGLVVGLKNKGLWAKMKAFVGGTAALHKWNLVDPRDLDAAYRLTFMGGGGAHSDALGYRANAQGAGVGSSSFADTHLIPAGLLANDSQHLAFYGTQDVPPADRAEMGAFNWGASGRRFHIIARYAGTVSFYYGMASADFSNVVVAKTSGLFVTTRTTLYLTTAYIDGVSVAASGGGFEELPPVSVYIGAINEFANRSDVPCGFASVGDALTDQNVADLYEVVQAYQTALGRAI
jgi:hypothetical protein